MKKLILLMLTIGWLQYIDAQEVHTPAMHPADTPQSKTKKSIISILPYYNYNRELGSEFGLLPMINFKLNHNDTISPRSVIGVMGFYSMNKSYGFTNFGQFFWKEDHWRLIYSIGYGLYNFQTYYQVPGQTGGEFIDYGTHSFFAAVDLRRKIVEKIFLGMGFIYQDSKSIFQTLLPEQEIKLKILNFEFFRDNRSSVYYPRHGNMIYAQFRYLPKWLGNTDNTTILILNYNQYFPSRKNTDVIAIRAHTKAGLSKLAFQQQPVLGGQDLRGYSQGQFRGNGVMDVQGEYRFNFSKTSRWGLVGFAGLGTIYGSAVPSFDWKAYYSVGTGFRFIFDKVTHMDIGLDIAKGKDDFSINFQLNEAF